MADSAQSATVQFTDLASFQANTTGLTNIDFEGIAPAGGSVLTSFNNPTGLSLITDVRGNGTYTVNVVDSAAPPPENVAYQYPYAWGSGAVLGFGSIQRLTVDFRGFPTGVTAAGIDFMSLVPLGQVEPFTFGVAFEDGSGETFTRTFTRTFELLSTIPTRQFFGITSTKNIAFFSVEPSFAYSKLFDNLTFSTASPTAATSVPEPFTIIGTLVGGTAALRMRKKLKSAGK
ncbi:PEP-CTERM sorting domain-containing protein [Chamaesiphon minutus]|uniref:PEP-CTERM sorting domain-containing protein n=1 Tax=Chamaesiphon minutus TaxID=1173032 RepID=UPI0012FC54BE|nr:PEP-CTERM sorting domain-containing protein [Chamaesiphon minutus]